MASKLAEYEAREIIPNDVLQDADKQPQVRVNKLIQQDQTVIWSILQTRRSSKLNSAFLSEELTSAGRKKRSLELQIDARGGQDAR